MAAPKTVRTYLTDAEEERLLRIPVPASVTGGAIRAFRRHHRLRVRDLARLLGLSPLTITRREMERPSYQRTTAKFTDDTLFALALRELDRRLVSTPLHPDRPAGVVGRPTPFFRTTRTCNACGQPTTPRRRGLCQSCYDRWRWRTRPRDTG